MEQDDENIRQSDVTLWGVVALICGALAVFSLNFGAVLPAHIMTGLHSTRLEGGNLNALRTQVAQILDESTRIRNENRRMQVLLSRAEKGQSDMVKRVGAIESTLPGLLEADNGGSVIDNSLITAAIGGGGEAKTIEAEGGSVKISQRPLHETRAPEQSSMPAPPVAIEAPPTLAPTPRQRQAQSPDSSPGTQGTENTEAANVFGMALGSDVTLLDAMLVWKDINRKAGPLLLGLEPLISGNANDETLRLIAGPIASYSQAETICGRLLRVGIACLPVSYSGTPLTE